MKKNILDLNNYVTITKNNSNIYEPADIVNICKRRNNLKRDFLFVNSLQGKHLHVDPCKIFALYDELVKSIIKSTTQNEKVIVVGFAETATAIGHYIASSLSNCIYYMQTTREQIPNATSLLEFKEEHSHAMEQFLYGDISELTKCDKIIFVDDEISTGNTVLNFISEIEKIGIHVKYGVASLLNWQNDEWSDKFEKLNIDTYFVLRGKLKDLNVKVPISVSDEMHVSPNIMDFPKVLVARSDISNYSKERIGSKPYPLSGFSEIVYSTISSTLNDHMPMVGDDVLVLGTEEYMFTPMIFAKELCDKLHTNVQFHATTRSPIETADRIDYAIRTRYPITSCYDYTRKTYIYNLRKYDKVYIITDVIPNSNFIIDISSALVNAGCKIQDIIIITMKGY
ncbi:MAG: phosphoribosyltransferase domain-containing protein [Clostridia bacterium]|nr:phosphoribosyltransferase domain-containing protein [Clostridia bacterium]